MKVYVPTHKDLPDSWELSAELWRQVGGLYDGMTQYLFEPLAHPETGVIYFYADRAEAEALGLDVGNAVMDLESEADDEVAL